MERGQIEVQGESIAYTVRRSLRRQRTISLRLDRGEVVVLAPARLPPAMVRDFVLDRGRWILDRRAALTAVPARPLTSRGTLPYRGAELPVQFQAEIVSAVRIAFDGERFHVAIPQGLAPCDADAALGQGLRRWFARRAAEMLEARVALRAADMGVVPGRVLVRDQRTRWGSCAADGTLRFNWRTALVAPDLLDYVVVHELAHLVRRDHSPAFWAIVGGILPDHRALRTRLHAAQALDPFVT